MNERDIIISTLMRNIAKNMTDDDTTCLDEMHAYYESMSAKELILSLLTDIKHLTKDTEDYIRTCF